MEAEKKIILTLVLFCQIISISYAAPSDDYLLMHTTATFPQRTTSTQLDSCLKRPDPGPCLARIPAYYYDIGRQACKEFIYGGCGGNANRFQSVEQCQRLCGTFRNQDICNLPPKKGFCRALLTAYYYDAADKTCRRFDYGGCGGNANRFSTINECESVCIHHEEPGHTGTRATM